MYFSFGDLILPPKKLTVTTGRSASRPPVAGRFTIPALSNTTVLGGTAGYLVHHESFGITPRQKTTADAALELPVPRRSNDHYRREENSMRPFPNVRRDCGHKSSAWDTFNDPHRSRILDGGAA